jgi:1-acyl-sn-glycerol-3-phosphate acyltransferase
MLDLPRLNRIRLYRRPLTQRIVARVMLGPNYTALPGVRIEFENFDRVPPGPVIFAMNHTDRYNYFPFMYKVWRLQDRFMTVWVKGKYYEQPAVGMFMELTNNLPTVSRGYIITKDFALTMGRRPNDQEYAALRALVDAEAEPGGSGSSVDVSVVPRAIFDTPRNMLGIDFDPAARPYAASVNEVFAAMMKRFVKLNEHSFELGLDLLIFPQGTRSIRLPRGHIGLAEIALRYGKTIVPVGCNGSDRVYPGSLPLGKKGRIVYRFGQPIPYEELAPFHIGEDFQPFSAEAEHAHRDKFQGAVDLVMDRINELLDPEYRYSDDLGSEGVQGTSRFM